MSKKRDTKKFHLGDILSVMTGVICLPNGFSGVKDILTFMTGESSHTTQCGRFADECLPYLQEQFPQLVAVTPDECLADSIEQCQKIIDRLVMQYGAWHTVRHIHPEDHQVLDPRIELAMQFPYIEQFTIVHESEE